MIAAAPSEICEELLTVWIAVGMTGLRRDRASGEVSRRPSSRSTRRHMPWPAACSSSVVGTWTAKVSFLKRSSDQATAARSWDSRPSPSTSSRLRPLRRAMRSAASNWFGRSTFHSSGNGFPGPCFEPEPSGTRDIASTPQLMPTSMTPDAIMFAVMWDACCDEPHWQSTVVAAVSYGRPIVSQAVRAGFMDCSPHAGDRAADYLLHGVGGDAGAAEEFAVGLAEEVGGVQIGERAAALADGGADCFHDHGFGGHGCGSSRGAALLRTYGTTELRTRR